MQVKRARAKQLSPDEFTTGTFTISNLGMFGVESFDAILPPGESRLAQCLTACLQLDAARAPARLLACTCARLHACWFCSCFAVRVFSARKLVTRRDAACA
jgi:hypothetical protein